jgi:chromosome segregation ATPase
MTKRFQWIYIKDNTLELRDNGIVKVFNNERLEELLNDLNEENEQLKARIQYLERKIQRERNSYMKEHEKWEKEIQKENEQLKEEIKDLNDVLARYEEKELKSE